MPTISMFFGIIIRMYFAPSEYSPPHFHAYYNHCKGTVDIRTCEVLTRDWPKRQARLVLAWAELHQDELIGGDLSMTIPYEWQLQFNGPDVPVIERMQNPVPKEYFDLLYEKLADFLRAYEPDGMTVEEFDSFGATVRTLRAFTTSWHDLVNLIRDFMLPNPDVK